MDISKLSSQTKMLPTLIACAIVLVTAITTGFIYLQKQPTQSPASSTATSAPAVVADPVLTSAATVTTAISDLDVQLAQIESDLKTTYDTIPTL